MMAQWSVINFLMPKRIREARMAEEEEIMAIHRREAARESSNILLVRAVTAQMQELQRILDETARIRRGHNG